jgi:hypothetical protein
MGPDRIEQHARAGDIGAPGLVRVTDRAAHQRLGGHVHHQIGLRGLHDARHGVRIADIGDMAVGLARDIGQLEQRGPRFGRKPHARHLRAHGREPERRPAPLEPGMAGQKDAFVLPEGGVWHGGGLGLGCHRRPLCGRCAGPLEYLGFPSPCLAAPPDMTSLQATAGQGLTGWGATAMVAAISQLPVYALSSGPAGKGMDRHLKPSKAIQGHFRTIVLTRKGAQHGPLQPASRRLYSRRPLP